MLILLSCDIFPLSSSIPGVFLQSNDLMAQGSIRLDFFHPACLGFLGFGLGNFKLALNVHGYLSVLTLIAGNFLELPEL
tara:strand:- start:398 stop:634 length:237 start_codon:yes stop_codon:yes gene_type:complete